MHVSDVQGYLAHKKTPELPTPNQVERVFGILKTRWRILKVPCMWHFPWELDNEFRFCCIMHNRIHYFQESGAPLQREARWLKEELDQGYEEADLESIEAREEVRSQRPGHQRRFPKGVASDFDCSQVGSISGPGSDFVMDCEVEREDAHEDLRRDLIAHYGCVSAPGAPRGTGAVWLQ